MGQSSMSDLFTSEEIANMQQWLRDYPIDHQFDEECELFDGNPPAEQMISRNCLYFLKKLGKLPEDILE